MPRSRAYAIIEVLLYPIGKEYAIGMGWDCIVNINNHIDFIKNGETLVEW